MKQAIILIAGKGRRLVAVSEGRPKCLMPVGSTTLLDFQIQSLIEAGIDRIILVVGYRHQVITRHIASVYPNHKRFVLIRNPKWRTTNVLGSLFYARRHLSRGAVLLHGDTLYPPALMQRLVKGSVSGARLVVQKKKVGEEEMKFISNGHGEIVALSKHLTASLSEGEFMGISYLSSAFGSALQKILESHSYGTFKNDYYEWGLLQVHAIHKMSLYEVDASRDPMIEIDFPADYAYANRYTYPKILKVSKKR